jgi:hypothetical protein
MTILNKSLLIGIGAGVALTLVLLEVWGSRYQRELYLVSMPRVIRPFLPETEMGRLLSVRLGPLMTSEKLPRAWVPQVSGSAHDDWQLEGFDGKKLKLSALRGKAVFLNFWNTH